MVRKNTDNLKNPTDKELEILTVLWQLGSATVKQINEQLNKTQPVGYTTTLKLMQIMTEKGLLCRDDSTFQHTYSAAISQEKTQKQIIGNLMDKAFAGSAGKLVLSALSTKKISKDELKEIKKLLGQIKEK